jgi:hypothetical protein
MLLDNAIARTDSIYVRACRLLILEQQLPAGGQEFLFTSGRTAYQAGTWKPALGVNNTSAHIPDNPAFHLLNRNISDG